MALKGRVLAVDDNRDNLLVLEEILVPEYTVMCVTSGEDALQCARSFLPDVVLLDVLMPGINGIETCRSLRAMPELKGTRIAMLSAKNQLRDRLAAYDVGAIDYLAKPFSHFEVVAKVNAWFSLVQKEKLDEIWQEAETAKGAVGTAMLGLASFRDTETGDHLFRVRLYAQLLAMELQRMGPYREWIDDTFLKELYLSTPLHDIGKVAINDAILRKPGPLTTEEFQIMKTHTVVGSQLLRAAAEKLPSARYLTMAAEVARHHHERFDGSGYPDGLSGQTIPLSARILCIADVFDALTSKRPYKNAISVSEAARIILEESGEQFDPAVVAAFKACLEDFHSAQRNADSIAENDLALSITAII